MRRPLYYLKLRPTGFLLFNSSLSIVLACLRKRVGFVDAENGFSLKGRSFEPCDQLAFKFSTPKLLDDKQMFYQPGFGASLDQHGNLLHVVYFRLYARNIKRTNTLQMYTKNNGLDRHIQSSINCLLLDGFRRGLSILDLSIVSTYLAVQCKLASLVLVLFIGIAMSLSNVAYGQGNASEIDVTVDSLINAIETTPDFDFGELTEQLFRVAEENKHSYGIFMAYWYKSNLMLIEEDYVRAEEYVNLMIDFSEDLPDNLITAHTQLINIHTATRAIDKALVSMRILLYNANLTGSYVNKADAYYSYSLIYNAVGDLNKEKNYLLKSLKYLSEAPDDEESFALTAPFLHGTIGSVYSSLSKPDSAQYHFVQADTLFNTPEYELPSIDKALFYKYFGIFYLDLPDYKKAEKYCRLALNDEREFGSNQRIAECELCLAEALLFQNQVGLADSLISAAQGRSIDSEDIILKIELAELQAKYIAIVHMNKKNGALISHYIHLKTNDEKREMLDKIESFKSREELLLKQFETDSLEEKLRFNRIASYLLLGLSTSLLMVFILLYFQQRSRKRLKDKALEAKHTSFMLKETENELLRNKINSARQNIVSKSLLQAKINNTLESIVQLINELKSSNREITKADLDQLQRKISVEKNSDENWQDFLHHFEQIDPEFFSSISRKYPLLTQRDLRLITLIRVGLSNQEIGQLLNISNASVNTARYRLRKKFDLIEETDLNLFVNQL